MGNRAVITTRNKKVGVYLHWNGGYTSIKAFLDYCKLQGYRRPDCDIDYAMARLCQVIANFFGGGNSIGIGCYENLDIDNGDNGTYIIGGDWEIVGREFADIEYDELDKDQYYEMLEEINNKQPENEKIKNIFEVLNEQTIREILKNEELSLDEKIAQLKKVGL